MREITGNLWDYWQMNWYCQGCLAPLLGQGADCMSCGAEFTRPSPTNFHICITTNGDVNSRGYAVMGRGCALEATKKLPGFARELAGALKTHGNHVWRFRERVITFPVKHHWHERADLNLIARSCHELCRIIEVTANCTFVLPRPGCGNGHLNWEEVREVIAPILPDNVWVITHA